MRALSAVRFVYQRSRQWAKGRVQGLEKKQSRCPASSFRPPPNRASPRSNHFFKHAHTFQCLSHDVRWAAPRLGNSDRGQNFSSAKDFRIFPTRFFIESQETNRHINVKRLGVGKAVLLVEKFIQSIVQGKGSGTMRSETVT